MTPGDKKDEESARAFLSEHYSLVAPLRVCRLDVAANRTRETQFNTPLRRARGQERASKRKRE